MYLDFTCKKNLNLVWKGICTLLIYKGKPISYIILLQYIIILRNSKCA